MGVVYFYIFCKISSYDIVFLCLVISDGEIPKNLANSACEVNL